MFYHIVICDKIIRKFYNYILNKEYYMKTTLINFFSIKRSIANPEFTTLLKSTFCHTIHHKKS